MAAAARKHGITEATLFRWRKLYDGMQLNDVNELKALRDENTRLKKLLAEGDLEVDLMNEIKAKSDDAASPTREGATGLSARGN